MSIEDDLVEQERWERNSAAYKRTHPAPCPELVREKQSKMCAEKDAIIDWFAGQLSEHDMISKYGSDKTDWIKAAQEAVKKND